MWLTRSRALEGIDTGGVDARESGFNVAGPRNDAFVPIVPAREPVTRPIERREP